MGFLPEDFRRLVSSGPPDEFICAARESRHPIDLDTFLPESLVTNVFYLLTTPSHIVAAERLKKIQNMCDLAHKMQPQNTAMFAALDPLQANVFK